MKRDKTEPNLGRVVFDDLRSSDLQGTLRQDLRDLYRFYLSDERREQLAGMGTVRGIVYFWAWLFKSLLTKLSPTRRIFLLAALLLLLWGRFNLNLLGLHLVFSVSVLGFALLFVVLMLELKDKLLARDEIEIARQVQLALLPPRAPQPDGWTVWGHTRPANDVGGDLVDYIDLEDGRLAVVLGDVAGKGLGAALLMAKLQATLRATAPGAPSLEALGKRMNHILHRDGLDNRYATLFLAVLETDSGRVRYLNAGHNPPFVLRAGEGADLESLEPSSPPLGMIPDLRISEGSVQLGSGDLVVVYSDGLTEAVNPGEEEYGLERLRRVLPRLRGRPADQVGQRLLEEVEKFMGDARPYDDLSLVVVART